MFACDDAVPAVALVVVVPVVWVVAEVFVLAEPAEVDVVLPLEEELTVATRVEAVPLAGVAVTARPPVSATIAATLPAPTTRRDRRAGCGLRFRAGRAAATRPGW